MGRRMQISPGDRVDSDLLERIRRALLSGEGVALSSDDSELSWRELAGRIARLEADLDANGIAPGATVAVLGRNTISCAICIFAIVLSRRCAIIINPFTSPEAALESARQLSPQAILIPVGDDMLRAANSDPALLVLQEDGALVRLSPAAQREPSGDRRAGLIVYTSGTTGDPKPLHLSLSTLSRAMHEIERTNAGFGDCRCDDGLWPALIQYSPLAHIGGVLTLLRAAAQGRSTVMLGKFDAERWAEIVQQYQLKTTGLPPSMLRMVLEAEIAPERLSSLISVWSGTAPLRAEDRQAFSGRYGIPVLGNYGATEFCGAIAAWSLEDFRMHFDTRPSAVGRLDPTVAQARVRSLAGEIVEGEGQVGVLEFKVGRIGDHWIPTSDLGSVDGDGFLTLHGRKDDVIIRGGFKLSPAKISDVLRQHPAVRDAAVVGVADKRLGQLPVAVVELELGAKLDSAEIREFVRARLPAYFVPARIKQVQSLPRNSAMKLDRRAIASLFHEHGDH